MAQSNPFSSVEKDTADETVSREDSSAEVETASTPEPNIAFVGDGEPLTKINNGMETIKLPKADEQAEPFYHKDAGAIIQLFPDQYKRFVKKGE